VNCVTSVWVKAIGVCPSEMGARPQKYSILSSQFEKIPTGPTRPLTFISKNGWMAYFCFVGKDEEILLEHGQVLDWLNSVEVAFFRRRP
jgi:hypothetical protein